MKIDRDSLPLIADDYVIGLMDETERREMDEFIENDPQVRRAVAASRDRFLELDLTAQPLAPTSGLWQRIDESIRKAAPADTAPLPEPAVLRSPANQNRYSAWRNVAMVTTAASLVLVAVLGWNIANEPAPKVIAVLLDPSGQPLALVEDFGDTTAKITTLTNFQVPEGKTMQVWTLPSKEIGPVSLGLLPSSERLVLHGPDLPEPHEGQLYEITLEPRDGSPTGRPTGAILVKGYARDVR